MVTFTFGVESFDERVADGLDRALHVGLDDELELELIGLGEARREGLERDARVLRDERLRRLLAPRLGDLLGRLRVLDGVHRIAGARHVGQAEHLDRRRRAGLGDGAAVLVGHRADLAPSAAGEDDVADAQRAVLDEDARDRTAAAIEERLDDGAARAASSGSP